MTPRPCSTALFVSLVVALLTSFASGQATVSFAQLNGTVLDTGGRAVVRASVTIHEPDNNQTSTTVTNDTGFFVFPSLQPGRYDLTVTYTGFAKSTQTGIPLTVGQTATINVTLKVAAAGETVIVTTEAPTVETTRTEVSQVIDTKQIADLPTSSRRFTDFALLSAGVATSRTSVGTTFTEFEATQISFGGMRSFSNEITVDGADFVNANAGLQRSTPPQEAVQEFRVVNNSFGSEYGRALGGIVNIVTKSGTNSLHGSIYDYFQNDATDARSLLAPAPDPHALRQNQFGIALGGPIVKDKTFFFVNYEGQRRDESPTLPPDLLANLTTINIAKSYLGLAPENPNILQTNHNDYGFARLDHQINNNNRLAIRYNVEDARDTNELVGNTEDGGGIGTPSGGRNLFVRDQSLVGTVNSLVSSNLVNTAMGQYARRHYDFPGATGQPDLDIPNDLSFGHNFGTFDTINESRAQFSDSVAWVKGNHLAKFGFDFNYVWDYTGYPGFTPERIILPNLNCMADFANFVHGFANPISFPGLPCPFNSTGAATTNPFADVFEGVPAVLYGVALARTGYVDGQAPLNNALPLNTQTWANAYPPQLSSSYAFLLNHGYYGVFAQDQWRVTPRLTVNYGLRWDVESGLSREINNDYGAFQPRVGLAYSPDSKTVIRAGYGIFFDRNNLTFFNVTGNQKTIPGYLPGIKLPMVQTQAASGGWQLNQVVAPEFSPSPVTCIVPIFPGGPCLDASAQTAAYILKNGTYPTQYIAGDCPPACTAGAGGIDRNVSKLPYAEQATLEIDHQFGKGLTIEIGYLYVGAHRLVQGNGINISCPVGTSKPQNPMTTTATQTAAQGWLNPNGTLTSCSGTPVLLFGKPTFNGLEFSNAGFMDYNDDVDNAAYNGGTFQVIERLGKYFSLNGNYTYSHTIDLGNFTTFINLPQNQFDQDAERASSNQDVRHRVVTNFTVDPPKSSFLRNFELSSIITMQSGRPFTEFVGFDANNDTNAYTDRPGLLGRNSYVGDTLYAWDLRVSRYINLSERLRLDLSLDSFNTLNRPNVNEVVDVYGSPEVCGAAPTKYRDAASLALQSGSISCPVAVAPAGVTPPAADAAWFNPAGAPPPSSIFGTPRTMFNPRQLQFSAKFSF